MTDQSDSDLGYEPEPGYNWAERRRGGRRRAGEYAMERILTTIRCVPRFGYEYTNVRTVDIDVVDANDEQELFNALTLWFNARNIPDAVYDIDVDDDGFFAIVNDEAFRQNWGTPIL
jgi:hypothetical protein